MVISVSFAFEASTACPAVIPVNDAEILFCRDLVFGMMDSLLAGEVCLVIAVDICSINKKKGEKGGKVLFNQERAEPLFIPNKLCLHELEYKKRVQRGLKNGSIQVFHFLYRPGRKRALDYGFM